MTDSAKPANAIYAFGRDQNTKLYVVYEVATGDVLAMIPNGKMRLAGPAAGECKACLRGNRDAAKEIAELLNWSRKNFHVDCGKYPPAQAKRKRQ